VDKVRRGRMGEWENGRRAIYPMKLRANSVSSVVKKNKDK